MTAIFKREVKSYFTGMIGWVIAAVSLFFLGLYYTNRNLLYASSWRVNFWPRSLCSPSRWRRRCSCR